MKTSNCRHHQGPYMDSPSCLQVSLMLTRPVLALYLYPSLRAECKNNTNLIRCLTKHDTMKTNNCRHHQGPSMNFPSCLQVTLMLTRPVSALHLYPSLHAECGNNTNVIRCQPYYGIMKPNNYSQNQGPYIDTPSCLQVTLMLTRPVLVLHL